MNEASLKNLNGLFDRIFAPLNAAPQGSPGSTSGEANGRIADVPAVAAAPKQRVNRQHFIESELVEFRPDFLEASEILSALKTGLALKVGPYGDDLPIEVEHAFEDLRLAMDAATPYEPEAYDSMSDLDRYEENGAPYGK